MYLDRISINGMKLLRDFNLIFRSPGKPLKKWTVLIGRNGTSKTTVLQAIALAAMGGDQVNRLAGATLRHLTDRRMAAPSLSIEAEFSFAPEAFELNVFPGLKAPVSDELVLCSRVGMVSTKKNRRLTASSSYECIQPNQTHPFDPLSIARAEARKLWFVAGYSQSRILPPSSRKIDLKQDHLMRLKPLFDPTIVPVSTSFISHFRRKPGGSPTKARRFVDLLNKVLQSDDDLLPSIIGIERRGKGGIDRTSRFQDSARFLQQVGDTVEKVPAVALAHGQQSTIAWIADLVGHIVNEASTDLDPADMRGLVLIDELDLYLHPTWQVRFVRALKHTFPGLQFIVTTHSPLVLASLDPREDQIVRLEADPSTGHVRPELMSDDPRVLTSAELLRLYFELDDVHPDAMGRMVRDYCYLAANPYRDDGDDAKLDVWLAAMRAKGIDPGYTPVDRREFVRGRG